MKIVHLARLYSPHVGGVEKHLEKINKFFFKENHEVVVITQRYDLELPLIEEIDGVVVMRLAGAGEVAVSSEKNDFFSKLNYKINTWKELYKHWKIILEADVIHVHDVMWWLLPFYPFVWKKLFITFHGYEGNDLPTWMQVFWHRLSANLSKGTICVGGFHKKWYGVKPTITTYGAVEKISPQGTFSRSAAQLVFIGRLAEDNGILKYLETLKILKKQGHDFSLDVYGDGPLLEKSKKFTKKHKLKVTFHGFVPDAHKLIHNYDLVFVSRYLGILEAMSENKKIIAQFHNSLTEDYLKITPFNEWITIASNAEEIAQGVLEAPSLKKEAKTWAKKQTWKKMAENYLKLWQK